MEQDVTLHLTQREAQDLEYLLYRVLEEPGTPADTRLLRERIVDKLEGVI